MDKGGRGKGRGQSMWIVTRFYNSIIKFANADRGGRVGGKTLIHKMGINVCFFLH